MRAEVAFLLGMIGALAPEIVRLYAIRTRPSRFRWSPFYLVISFLFACLGGVVALALPATNYWAALYAGVSTPVLVTAILRRGINAGRDDLLKRPSGAGVGFQSFLEALTI
jgi:hypothetical protein